MDRSLNIRSAVVAELERLSVLWRGVEYLYHQALPHIFCKPDEGWPTRSAVERLIVGPDSTILVAETDNDIDLAAEFEPAARMESLPANCAGAAHRRDSLPSLKADA